jgi:hypothetical protein
MQLSVQKIGDNKKYLNNEITDSETQLHRRLIVVINMYPSLDFQRFSGRIYQEEKYSENEIIDAIDDFIDVITTIAGQYPYYGARNSEHENQNNSIDRCLKWSNDLIRLNIFYINEYNSRRFSIDKLIQEYQSICKKRRKTVREKGWYSEKELEGGTIMGQYTKEGDELCRDGKVDMSSTFDRTKVIPEFFNKLLLIQASMTEQVSESVHTLKYNEQTFRIKEHSIIIVIFSIFLIIFGIIIPMFLLTVNKEFIIVQRILLFVTMIPYIYGLLYLLQVMRCLQIQ